MSPARRSISCRLAARLLTGGERTDGPLLAPHLERCAACRRLARDLSRIRHDLAVSAVLAPPPTIERAVRARLLRDPVPLRTVLRPAMATGLAVAGQFAGVAGVAAILAGEGAADLGPVLAIGGAAVYLTLSAVATLPLLVRARARADRAELGVRA